MKNRAQPYLPIAILGLALLAILPGLAAAQEATPHGADLAALLNVTKAACHGNVSCQPYYPSCASWSGYSDCGDAWCGIGGRCGGCYCDEYYFCDCDPGPLWISYQERFRVCFDQYGNSCTEWQQISSSYCGC